LPLHPAIATSGFAALGAVASCPVVDEDRLDAAVMCPGLLQRFAAVSDGRGEQARAHPVAVVLALCAAAVVAGMRSFTVIAGWAADVPAELLAELYGRASPGAPLPTESVITRVDHLGRVAVGTRVPSDTPTPTASLIAPAAPEPSRTSRQSSTRPVRNPNQSFRSWASCRGGSGPSARLWPRASASARP